MKERCHLQDPGLDGSLFLKLHMKQLDRMAWTLTQKHVPGSCKHCNEQLGSIKYGFLASLRKHKPLTKDYAS